MWGEPVKPVRLLLTATLLGFGFALGGLLFRVVSDGVSNQAGKRG